ncbi:hypothetical protein GCM10008995_17920 [Halobellus salinus]|uniref:HVO-0234-like beta-propeller domain-containing protein n=1 Tax=Halobellus salinus TaxID=931585 RepID=A0A830EG29_9EURY|nr:hypothetical protein [Halobellus salinus]GGJ08509.1 hypothetical protein GCM10008995_17920 [Halobellus salinus]SMP28242.1 hypothetical protein SAMN06265347_11364 [Halobellus salinus]
MPTIDEKRVYTDASDTETVYLASGLGVVSVSVSDDLIGEFRVAHRCRARDVATAGPYVAVATDGGVLVHDRRGDATTDAGDGAGADAEEGGGSGFAATGFGPATAVGFRDGALLAGDTDGRVGRFDLGDTEAGAAGGTADAEWGDLGRVEAVRAIDGDFIAAADGVHRIGDSGLRPVGLDDARDVDAEPLVAAGSGVYKLGNGWMDVASGSATAVDAAGERGAAVCNGDLYARAADAGEWTITEPPFDGDATVAAVAHGAAATYAVTEAGRLAVRVPGGAWRDRNLGVREVAAAAV